MNIIGTGTDIVEIDRIDKAIKKWGDHFLNHVFTNEEILYSKKHRNAMQHFAARFAAKEAVYKALGDRPNVGWKDISITNDSNGKPSCTLKLNGFTHTIHLSLSHTKNYAVANAIITD